VQIHNPNYYDEDSEELARAMESCRRLGKVAHWGLSVDWIIPVLKYDAISSVQAPFNLLFPNNLNQMSSASACGFAVISRQPYCLGVLCKEPWNVPEKALRFCLSQEFSTVLVGMQTEEELEMNLRWAEKGPLPLEPK